MILHTIRDLSDSMLSLIQDDPVRPEISADQRVNHNSCVFVLKDDQGQAVAVTCVKLLASIPATVQDLFQVAEAANTAVFYTIWSYVQGAGRSLIKQALLQIQLEHPEVTTFVTLSPKTQMAERFHLKNGAATYRENADTVNYQYQQP